MVKIDFEFDSEYGVFRDALYFPEEELPSAEEIEAMKKQRFDDWISFINGQNEAS